MAASLLRRAVASRTALRAAAERAPQALLDPSVRRSSNSTMGFGAEIGGRHSTRINEKGDWSMMAQATAGLCGALLLGTLAGCSVPVTATLYAVVPPTRGGETFNRDLAALARREGLTPQLGHATDDQGQTLYVLEANGAGTRLWSQNVYLTGEEDPVACGRYSEAHPDPGQFVFTVSPLPLFGDAAKARKVFSRIGSALSALGYEIRETEVSPCSSLSRLDRNPR
jgi:hypothetical protein